jgi:diguanylate cyclase (GGDEF)-like protein/putative nucleotidyltransferase with HDIG domain
VASRSIGLSLGPSLFNLGNITISLFAAGKTYYALHDYLAAQDAVIVTGSSVIVFAVPLAALALTHYLLHIIVVMTMSLARGRKALQAVSGTLPWEPITYLACASVAGFVNYAFITQNLFSTIAILLLVAPIPIIIYYTFKTYHDRLGEQEKHSSELTSIYDSILEMLAMAIDAKDDVTHDHIQRVKLFARRMGEMVGLSNLEIEALKAGALLHDIGKIGVPAYILNKPGKLTEHEFEQMKMHTIIGADMLSNVDFRYPVVPIVRHHHERWDGRGYPDGLKGEEIPITARILTLVDNYDALRSDRPYKTGMTREEALDYIEQNAGTFFDPQLVKMFLSIVDKLEQEAASASFKAPQPDKRAKSESAAMAQAKPAAGFAAAPQVDRAAAALNSIAETNQRVTALYELSRTLSSILSLEDTVAILANRLSKLIPFTTCAISLYDGTRSEFEIVHAVGLHADKFIKRRMQAEAGITGYVITNQRPMYNTNPALDLGFLGVAEASRYRGVIVFPLVKNHEALGAIALYSTEITAYGSEHIQLMESVSQPASDAVYNALTFEEAQRSNFLDPSTGFAGKRALMTQFDREFARSRRLGTPISLIAATVSNLEEAAAEKGVSTDQMLAHLERLMKQQVRETDLCGRHTGNLLVALLPESGQTEATEARARMRSAIQSEESIVSITFGSATSPGDGDSFDSLLEAALLDCNAARDSIDMLPAAMSGALDHKRLI